MSAVNVYLNFNGNCEAVFNFYQSVFGGEFSYVGRFSDMPEQEGSPTVPESDKNKIMHIGLPIGETTLMGCDVSSAFGQNKAVIGDNFSISINTDSKAEADRVFNALSKNGKVNMAMNDTFWGSYFGMLTDQFGINWMVSCETPQ